MESTLTSLCPTKETLIDLAYDVLPESEADLLHPHVQACLQCRQEYGSIVSMMRLADALPYGPVAPSPAIKELLRLEVAAMRPWHERILEVAKRWMTVPVPAWQAFAVGAIAAFLTQIMLSGMQAPRPVASQDMGAERLDESQMRYALTSPRGEIRRLEPVPVLDVTPRHREELQFGDAFAMRDVSSEAR